MLPDGTVQVQAAAGPIRVRQGEHWVPVDTTLRVTADGPRPVAVPGDRRFSAGGTGPMARLGAPAGPPATARSVEFGGAGALPTPVLTEDTATYPDALPGVDLVLTAARRGFSQKLIITTRPAATVLAALTSGLDPLRGAGRGPARRPRLHPAWLCQGQLPPPCQR